MRFLQFENLLYGIHPVYRLKVTPIHGFVENRLETRRLAIDRRGHDAVPLTADLEPLDLQWADVFEKRIAEGFIELRDHLLVTYWLAALNRVAFVVNLRHLSKNDFIAIAVREMSSFRDLQLPLVQHFVGQFGARPDHLPVATTIDVIINPPFIASLEYRHISICYYYASI